MRKPSEVVSLEYLVNQSFEGKYFIGHTPVIRIGAGSAAWSALTNPSGSGVNVYAGVFTANNYSDTPMICRVWLYTQPIQGKFSPYASVINLTRWPLPQPQARILYGESTNYPPARGASLFTRIAPAYTTISSEDNGKIVLGPGCSLLLFLSHHYRNTSVGEFAYGWWEDKMDETTTQC